LYINSSIRACIVEDLMKKEFEESLWCSLQLDRERLLIGLCYRSPGSTASNDAKLVELLESAVLCTRVDHVLIMGDFNYPEINYVDGSVSAGETNPATLFFNKTQELCLYQHVYEATRVRQHQVPSILDYVFTDEENVIDEISYDPPLGKSDHVALRWELKLKVQDTESSQIKFAYHKGDYKEIQAVLQVVQWEERWREKSVNEMWTDFTDILRELVHLHVPLKKELKRSKCRRISKQTKKKIRERGKAWHKYRQNPSGRNFELYKRLRNEVNRLIKQEEASARKRILRGFKGNPKRFYGYMRSMQTVKDSVTAIRKDNGELTVSEQESADLLSAHFQEVYTLEDTSYIPTVPHRGLYWSDDKLKFTESVIMEKLQKLRIDKSPGPDGVHPQLLKECASVIVKPLSIIFQKSFMTGIFPEEWKTATVVPIFKKGDRTDKANYRPVSLTSVPCKIMESIIKDKLVKFLEKHDVLCKEQHGFRSGRSCLTNLLEALENWTKALDEGYGLDIIYLDYRKAFDSVPHRRLLEKLKALGISGKLLRWFEGFLISRTMKVGVRGAFSQLLEVLSGVPQGSVLGPLLFLLFVNELPSWVQSGMSMFADDTKVWHRIKTEADGVVLQQDLDALVQWSGTWQLQFNKEKCKVMHMGHSCSTSYFMSDVAGSKQLEEVANERDLGVIISSDLKPSSQCITSAAKARRVIGMVRRNFRHLDLDDFRLIYRTYIRPHIEYCIQAWSPHLVKDVEVLENVQRAATTLVPKLRKYSYPQRLKLLGITSLTDRRERGDMIEVYKLLTAKEKINPDQFFKLAQNHYGLRGHDKKIVKERSRLDIRKFFFSQRVVSKWNSLPASVVDAESVNGFKNAYDRFFSEDMDASS